MSQATLTRRGFLKSTAAMGAVAALGISAADSLTAVDAAHADEASEVKIIKTSCRACIASCAVLAHVRDGRVVKIEGNPESPMSMGGVCAKGLAGIQALYHPNRNKYPMRRVGERGTTSGSAFPGKRRSPRWPLRSTRCPTSTDPRPSPCPRAVAETRISRM